MNYDNVSLTVDISVPMRQRSIERLNVTSDTATEARTTASAEQSLRIEKKYEGLEAAADALYDVLFDGDVYARNVLTEEIRDQVSDWDVNTSEATIRLWTQIHPAALYLAAHKYAGHRTQQSTVQKGYSTELILAQLFKDGLPYHEPRVTIDGTEHVSQAAYEAMKWYMTHTPGGDIDAAELPEYDDDRLSRKAMSPQ